VILLVCGLQLYGQQTASGAEGKFTTFDAPGAGIGFGQGTFPTAINPAGAITGYYWGGDFIPHGFLRSGQHGDEPVFIATGAKPPAAAPIVTFDVPGSNCSFDPTVIIRCTTPTGINPSGAITGYYQDANGFHGFLRAPNGTTFTNIDPPGTTGSNTTYAINPAGAITGAYGDASGFHGFLRAPNGTFTYPIDPPNSASSSQTYPSAINPAGAITGQYEDTSFTFHGFVRNPKNGMIISFDPSPGSQYVVPTGINPAGAITGWFQQTAMQPPNTGFLRAPNGKFITFDVMNSGQTFPSGINDAGTITGSYATSQYHGFLRRAGKFITFDPTGSQDTHPAAREQSRDTMETQPLITVSCGAPTTPRNDTEQLWNVVDHEVAHVSRKRARNS
jgi:hypothetical protein